MMSQCHCHCGITNLACDICCLWLEIFLFILYLQIDKNNQESGGVFIIFTFLLISVFTSLLFFFQFPDRSSQLIYPDFHQGVVLIQYFYLHQKFMFLCVYLSFFFFFFGGGGGCYSRTNEQILIIFLCEQDLAKGRSY